MSPRSFTSPSTRPLLTVLLPPLAPLIPFILLVIAVLIEETPSSPRMLNGQPDNAPLRAAGVLLFLLPFAYLFLLLVQLGCIALRHWLSCAISKAYLIAAFAAVAFFAMLSFAGARGERMMGSIVFAVAVPTISLLPMGWVTWLIERRRPRSNAA